MIVASENQAEHDEIFLEMLNRASVNSVLENFNTNYLDDSNIKAVLAIERPTNKTKVLKMFYLL